MFRVEDQHDLAHRVEYLRIRPDDSSPLVDAVVNEVE